MYRYNYTNELYHHGVKGMKWGVRRAKKTTSSGTTGKARTGNDSETQKKADEGKAKRIVSRGKAALSARRQRKAATIIANTANVTAGALRVAAAVSPAMPAVGVIAAAASAVGVTAGVAANVIGANEKK